MPQFDTFIFSSSPLYFILIFLLVLYLNFVYFLPRLSSIFKLRNKISSQNAKTQKNYASVVWTKPSLLSKASYVLILLGFPDRLFSCHSSKCPFLMEAVLSSKNELMDFLTITVNMALNVWASIIREAHPNLIYRSVSDTYDHYVGGNQYTKWDTAPAFYTRSLFNVKTRYLLINKLEIIRNYVAISLLFVFVVYALNLSSLEVTPDCSLAITLLTNKTLICPKVKYSHILVRGVKGITPKNGSSSPKLPPEGEKGKNNEDIPGNNTGEGIENQKLPISEITKNMENETSRITSQGSDNSGKETSKTFHEPQLPLLQNKIKNENSEGSTSSFDNIKKSNIDYEKTRNKEILAEKEQRKQSLLAFGASNNNNQNKIVQIYEEKEKVVEWPTLPNSQEAYQNIPTNVHENLVQEMEKYCNNNKEDKICEQLVENQKSKNTVNQNTNTLSNNTPPNLQYEIQRSNTYNETPQNDTEDKPSLMSTIETQKLLDKINQIPSLKNLMKIKPSNIPDEGIELNKLKRMFDTLETIISYEIKERVSEYKTLVYEKDPYPDDGLGFYHHSLKTEWQYSDNKKSLIKMRDALKEDNIQDSQLIHIGLKLTNVKYNDVDHKDLVENLFFSKKKAGDITMAQKFLKNKLPLEDEIIVENKPSVSKEEVLQLLNKNDFYISYINTKNEKYKHMFIEHGANSHMCLSISYQGKRLILGYLTSSSLGSEIAPEQLYDKEKPQNFTYLKHLCVEDENLIVDLEDYKQYCQNPKIKEILINEFSKLLDGSLNNPVTEVSIMSKLRFKKILINKIDEEICQVDSSLMKFKDPSLKDKEDRYHLKKFLESYQNSLDKEGANIITWYKEVAILIEALEEKKRVEDYELYKTLYPKDKKKTKKLEEL